MIETYNSMQTTTLNGELLLRKLNVSVEESRAGEQMVKSSEKLKM